MEPIVADRLVAQAQETAGLTDFGEPPIRPVLDVLVTAINDEAQLTAKGLDQWSQRLLAILVGRLRLADLLKRRPELLAAPLGPAIAIVGMPRSGTTKMQRMIASDTRMNFVSTWETLFPAPLSDSPDDRQNRIAYAQSVCEAWNADPQMRLVHEFDPFLPEEEVTIMLNGLLNESLDCEMRIPTYLKWLRKQDQLPTYRLLVTFLQLLAGEHGKRDGPWVLKGTFHGPYLDTMLEAIPSARIVYCHRDPIESIGSYCSLIDKLRSLTSARIDKHQIGREALDFWAENLRCTMAVRDRLPAGMMMDIDFRAIVTRTREVVEDIYAFAGIPLTAEAKAAHFAWDAQNGQHKHGKHDYALADYGLSAEMIAKATASYRARFIEPQTAGADE